MDEYVILLNMQKNEQTSENLVCINVPEAKVIRDPHTWAEISGAAKNKRASRIATEFDEGFKFIKKFPKSVTFYGSARFKPSNPHYKDAHDLAYRLSKEGYTIVSGGGPGIMEAANRGAKDAGGNSVGLNIRLPKEQIENPYVTASMNFSYFFSRKTTLSFSAEAYIFYPGGFGTLDEFFEIITLVQTRKIRHAPMILVGSDYWAPLHEYIKESLYLEHSAIDKKDMNLYLITDNHEEIVKIVKAAPIRI